MLLTSVATFKSLMGGPGPLARASFAAVGSDAHSLTPPTCSTVVTKREVGRRLRRNLPRWSVGGIVRRPSSPRASSPHMAPNADDTWRPRGTRTRTLTLKGGLGAWVSPGSGVCGGCAQDRLGFLSSCARFGLQGAAQTSGFDGFGTFCDRLLGYFGSESISRRAPDTPRAGPRVDRTTRCREVGPLSSTTDAVRAFISARVSFRPPFQQGTSVCFGPLAICGEVIGHSCPPYYRVPSC